LNSIPNVFSERIYAEAKRNWESLLGVAFDTIPMGQHHAQGVLISMTPSPT
jgi:hypothetical protein